MRLYRNHDKEEAAKQQAKELKQYGDQEVVTDPVIDDEKKITEVTDKVVAMLNRAGDAGDLVLQTDNLVKKYKNKDWSNARGLL